ncbi:putative E3 ubiquitin-protein ligase DTX3 isoform 2-T2 [Aplochiton taeniatus]
MMCPQCLLKVHMNCRVCHTTVSAPRGIQGKMSVSEMPISLQGHSRDSTVKVTYSIPDGIQGGGHPNPWSPFRGGLFEAYLPLCERTKKLLPRLERAFKQGLTFTVTGKDAGAQVTWDCIPHKTSLQGGKSR